jgi:hypothetical protein
LIIQQSKVPIINIEKSSKIDVIILILFSANKNPTNKPVNPIIILKIKTQSGNK